VLEQDPRVGGRTNRIEADGFRFDTGPSLLNYPWVFEDLFAAAGRRLEDYLELLPVRPSITFRWPDGEQLALSSDLRELMQACQRLEPGSRPGLLAFLADAERKYRFSFDKLVTRNADGIFSWLGGLTPGELAHSGVWRSMHAELARFFRNPRLREALGSYAMYLGGSPWDLPGLFSILPYGEIAYGLWLPRGGMYALVEALRRLAEELGVEIHTGCRVERVLVRDGRAAGLRLEDGRELSAAWIVSNVDVPTTRRDLLGSSDRPPRMTPAVITFYWGVQGTPAGLGHHTIFLPDRVRTTFHQLLKGGRIPDPFAFYVSMPSATDPALAPEGHQALFVLVPTPVLSRMNGTDWDRTVDHVRSACLKACRQVRGRFHRPGRARALHFHRPACASHSARAR
jgi:phytoene desaturase